jgi:hypothetical protein
MCVIGIDIVLVSTIFSVGFLTVLILFNSVLKIDLWL